MDIRRIVLRHARRAQLGDGFPFVNDIAPPDEQCP
jgi:hypothetical protein